MTELTWDGKYKDGKKVSPVRIALPFQTIETVNEKRKAGLQTDMFAAAATTAAKESGWKNRLIWGDKKYVLPSLLPEFTGKINLIYIDPPFDTGANFSFTAIIPQLEDDEDDAGISFTKQPNVIEQKAYRDTWGVSEEEKKMGKTPLDKYLKWFYETVVLLRELLTEDGSIYVHLDWHVGHYAKVVLDEVFGYENFRNEIVWSYPGRERKSENKFQSKHDIILFYSKSEKTKLNPIAKEWERDDRIKALRRKIHKDEEGKEWFWETRGQSQGIEPYRQYLDEYLEKGGALNDVWDDIQFLRGNHPERVGYDTQKPEKLLERVVLASSNEGDLVLDCFCGSGTTSVTAEKLGRRWVTCDLGRFAIHTTRKRLLNNQKVKPFEVQNLGKYERQQWMLAEFDQPEQRANIEAAYRKFILDLYHASPLGGYAWLHGAKAGRLVHVGSVDAPVSPGDVKALVLEFWKVAGKEKDLKTNGIDILAWDFAFELNEMAAQFAAENKVDLKFKKIPREVLEKKAVEQGDIRFFELASLGIDAQITNRQNRELSLTLENFIIPPDEVPEDVQGKISHWSQWVDYWAVDWNYHDDTFHNEWQSYRTRQNPKLELKVSHLYEEAGTYQVVVKVIDILGNDTTKLITIEI